VKEEYKCNAIYPAQVFKGKHRERIVKKSSVLQFSKIVVLHTTMGRWNVTAVALSGKEKAQKGE